MVVKERRCVVLAQDDVHQRGHIAHVHRSAFVHIAHQFGEHRDIRGGAAVIGIEVRTERQDIVACFSPRLVALQQVSVHSCALEFFGRAGKEIAIAHVHCARAFGFGRQHDVLLSAQRHLSVINNDIVGRPSPSFRVGLLHKEGLRHVVTAHRQRCGLIEADAVAERQRIRQIEAIGRGLVDRLFHRHRLASRDALTVFVEHDAPVFVRLIHRILGCLRTVLRRRERSVVAHTVGALDGCRPDGNLLAVVIAQVVINPKRRRLERRITIVTRSPIVIRELLREHQRIGARRGQRGGTQAEMVRFHVVKVFEAVWQRILTHAIHPIVEP